MQRFSHAQNVIVSGIRCQRLATHCLTRPPAQSMCYDSTDDTSSSVENKRDKRGDDVWRRIADQPSPS